MDKPRNGCVFLDDSGNFNLMVGESHEGRRGIPQHDRVALYWVVYNSGGAW